MHSQFTFAFGAIHRLDRACKLPQSHHSCAFDGFSAFEAHDIAVAFEFREIMADGIVAGVCVYAERCDGLPENVHDINLVQSCL